MQVLLMLYLYPLLHCTNSLVGNIVSVSLVTHPWLVALRLRTPVCKVDLHLSHLPPLFTATRASQSGICFLLTTSVSVCGTACSFA